MPETNETYQPLTFDAIKIGLASPEKILEWSHGEVKKPDFLFRESPVLFLLSHFRGDIASFQAQAFHPHSKKQ